MDLHRLGHWVAIAAVAFLAIATAACGGGSSNSSSTKTAASTNGGASASGAAISNPGGASSGGYCDKITRADVQALVPNTITEVGGDRIVACIFKEGSSGSVEVDIYGSDPDQKYYKSLSLSNDQSISGVGDQAYWNEPVPNASPPELIARKGNVTCVIQSNELPDSTIKATNSTSTGLFTVSDSDALAYVQLMGKVCNDAFAAK